MKVIIDIPAEIYESIQNEPENMCDSFFMSLIQVHNSSAIEIFKAIKNGNKVNE